jgi:hypothetical protein
MFFWQQKVLKPLAAHSLHNLQHLSALYCVQDPLVSGRNSPNEIAIDII